MANKLPPQTPSAPEGREATEQKLAAVENRATNERAAEARSGDRDATSGHNGRAVTTAGGGTASGGTADRATAETPVNENLPAATEPVAAPGGYFLDDDDDDWLFGMNGSGPGATTSDHDGQATSTAGGTTAEAPVSGYFLDDDDDDWLFGSGLSEPGVTTSGHDGQAVATTGGTMAKAPDSGYFLDDDDDWF